MNASDKQVPVVERDAVRCVVVDREGLVLLLRSAAGWELPGGGIRPGESLVDAARRELAEETGLVVDDDQVGEPTWSRQTTFRAGDLRRLQAERIVRVAVDASAPAVRTGGRHLAGRRPDQAYRWWPVADVRESRQRFYPGRLPELLVAFLDDQRIVEPFEAWS